jgi:hypothetical protein
MSTKYRLQNQTENTISLPGGEVIIPAGQAKTVYNEKVLQNSTIINWIRGGALLLLGEGEPLEQISKPDAYGHAQGKADQSGARKPAGSGGGGTAPAAVATDPVSQEVLSVLDQSMDKIAEQLPNLSDAEFDAVIKAEKDGKTRKGLVGPDGVFDQEWKRRYGIES